MNLFLLLFRGSISIPTCYLGAHAQHPQRAVEPFAQVETAAGSKRFSVDKSARQDFEMPARRREALQHSSVAEAEKLHVTSDNQV